MILGHEELPDFDLDGDPNQISEEMSSGIYTGQVQPQKNFQKKDNRKNFQNPAGMKEPNRFKQANAKKFEDLDGEIDMIEEIQDASQDEANISGIDFESSKEAILDQNFDAKRKEFKSGSGLSGLGSPTSGILAANFKEQKKIVDSKPTSINSLNQ